MDLCELLIWNKTSSPNAPLERCWLKPSVTREKVYVKSQKEHGFAHYQLVVIADVKPCRALAKDIDVIPSYTSPLKNLF